MPGVDVIYLVDGTLGAGKTYYALRQIESALTAGKVVVTNVDLQPDWPERVARANPVRRRRKAIAKRADRYRDRLLVAHDLEQVMRVRVPGKGEGRAVVVLDEAHKWLNSRMWGKDRSRLDVIGWLSSTRHYGMDVYLISQHIEDIDKQVRNRVEYRVRLRNLKRVKVAGVRIFPTNVFVAISELVSARQAPVAHRDYYLLSRRIAGMYDTHELAARDVPDDVIWLPGPRERTPTAAASAAAVADPDHAPPGAPDHRGEQAVRGERLSNSRSPAKNGRSSETATPGGVRLVRPVAQGG